MSNQTYNTGKCLAQLRPADGTAASLYSPPPGVRAEIQTIIVTNSDAGTALYGLFHDEDGTTYDESTAISWEISKATNLTDVISLTLWMTNPAGNFAVQTNTASAFTFTLYGIEHKHQTRRPGGDRGGNTQ